MKDATTPAGLDRLSSPEVFRRRALQWPDRVIFEENTGRSITFRQFHLEAQRWAAALLRAGVRSGDRVASLFPNSIEMMQLWIGIGWAKGWDVAVNTAYRGDILKYVIGNAEPKILFIEAPYLEAFLAVAPDLPSIETLVVWGGELPQGLRAFEVMNFANNHILDHGAEVFLNTIGQLREAGIQVIGAGANIAQARRPAIVEKQGVKIAFLGYNSIQVPSYQATVARPGCAPLKAHTAYQQMFEEAPGTPPRIRTFADDDDLNALVADVTAATQIADLVVVSLHWGPLLKSSHISDYQPVAAHAIIDAGADLILGHHPHTSKGVEVYKGKAIFYSVNHFIMKNEKPVTASYASHGYVTNSHIHDMLESFPGELGFYQDYPLYPFGPDTLNTMIVKVRIADKAIKSVAILPCRIGTDYQPRLLKNAEPEFLAVAEQIENYSAAARLSARFSVQGDEILVGT